MPDVLLPLAAALYALSAGTFVAALVRPRTSAARLARSALLLGAVVHAAGMALRMFHQGMLPVTNGVEGLSLLSWLLVVVFLVLRRRYPVEALGTFVAPLAFLHVAGSLVFQPGPTAVPPALKHIYFYVHVSMAVLGDAFLAMAAAASLAYLVQDRQIRLKRLQPWSGRLPNLNVIDNVSHRCVTIGFLFMSLGIATGAVYAKHAWHSYWSWDPRQVWSLLTWFMYAVMLHVRLISGWRGRNLAWLTVLAFLLVLAGAVTVYAFQWGLHAGDYDVIPGTAGGGG